MSLKTKRNSFWVLHDGWHDFDQEEAANGFIAQSISPDWSSTRPNSELQGQGACAITPENWSWYDPLEQVTHSGSLGWWESGFPPLAGMPNASNNSVLYGDNWGFMHQGAYGGSHNHVKGLYSFSNGTFQIEIYNGELTRHEKDEYYDLFVRMWVLNANQVSDAGIVNARSSWTTYNSSGNSTIQFVANHYVTELSGSWIYQVSDSSIHSWLTTQVSNSETIGIYMWEADY